MEEKGSADREARKAQSIESVEPKVKGKEKTELIGKLERRCR